MNPWLLINRLVRITTAAQVAILDYENENVNASESKNLAALRECHKQLGKLIKQMEHEA